MSTETEPQAKTLAERMYGSPETPPSPATATPARQGNEPESTAPQKSVAERMYGTKPPPPEAQPKAETEGEEEPDTLAERMYADSGVLESPEQYSTKLGGVFDSLEYQARYDGDEEAIQALTEGRRESAALLHEMRATRDEAREISGELGEWNQKYMDGAEMADSVAAAMRESTEARLKSEWGDQYDVKVGHAKRAAEAAMDRLPWLRELLESGAGNSETLVRHFARIGERNAKRAARAKR